MQYYYIYSTSCMNTEHNRILYSSGFICFAKMYLVGLEIGSSLISDVKFKYRQCIFCSYFILLFGKNPCHLYFLSWRFSTPRSYHPQLPKSAFATFANVFRRQMFTKIELPYNIRIYYLYTLSSNNINCSFQYR